VFSLNTGKILTTKTDKQYKYKQNILDYIIRKNTPKNKSGFVLPFLIKRLF